MRSAIFALPVVAVMMLGCALVQGEERHSLLNLQDIETVRSLSLAELSELPPDPSNRVADNQAAASLGRKIFFDERLSANGKVACATCHLPDRQFQDDIPLGKGVGVAARRTMPIAGTAYAPFLFWDGRKDSLWSQALGPLESAVEHGSDRTQVVRLVAQNYREEYERLFGPLPATAALPLHAGPVAGDQASAAWGRMPDTDRHAVTKAFANVGKAIEAYERTVRPQQTRFDEWVASPSFPNEGVLRGEEIAGLRLFIGKANCVTCHNGPLLTDNHFHNTGVPKATSESVDDGRASGVELVQVDAFNCLGPYSDARAEECTELRFLSAKSPEMIRAYKTPSLRGVVDRAPFMHAGQLASIEQVLAHYSSAPSAPSGKTELRLLGLTQTEKRQLLAFLRTLSPTK